MASNERIRKYLDAGSVLGQVSRGRAEEIVRELVNAGDIQRSQAQEWVDTLVERSRKSSEQILEIVRNEVTAQLGKVDGTALESLANQVAEILRKSAEAGRKVTKQATEHAGKVTKQATEQAGKVTKQATEQAGKVTKQATEQAGKTATLARDAATKVTSRTSPIDTAPKATSKSKAPKTAKPDKAAS